MYIQTTWGVGIVDLPVPYTKIDPRYDIKEGEAVAVDPKYKEYLDITLQWIVQPSLCNVQDALEYLRGTGYAKVVTVKVTAIDAGKYDEMLTEEEMA